MEIIIIIVLQILQGLRIIEIKPVETISGKTVNISWKTRNMFWRTKGKHLGEENNPLPPQEDNIEEEGYLGVILPSVACKSTMDTETLFPTTKHPKIL